MFETWCDEVSESITITHTYRLFKRRWYFLAFLTILNLSNGANWLSFATVADHAMNYYNVSANTINWLSLIFLVCYLPGGPFAAWMIDTVGLAPGSILGAWLNCVGSCLRLVSVIPGINDNYRFTVAMIGQTLCALSQPLIMMSPTKLAATWFPEGERTTANSIGSLANVLGILLANVLSPSIVHSSSDMFPMLLTYSIPSLIAALMTIAIRQSRPPQPVSHACCQEMIMPFFQGIKKLFRSKGYICLVIFFGACLGLFSVLLSLIEEILCGRGYTDQVAGTVGSTMIAVGVVAGVLTGLYVDKYKTYLEVVKIYFTLATVGVCALYIFMSMRDMTVPIIISASLFGFFAQGVYVVCLELGIECTYPVPEASSAGMMMFVGNIQGVIYQLIMQALAKPLSAEDQLVETCGDSGQDWTNSMLFLLVIITVSTLNIILFLNTKYKRLNDETTSNVFNDQLINPPLQ